MFLKYKQLLQTNKRNVNTLREELGIKVMMRHITREYSAQNNSTINKIITN